MFPSLVLTPVALVVLDVLVSFMDVLVPGLGRARLGGGTAPVLDVGDFVWSSGGASWTRVLRIWRIPRTFSKFPRNEVYRVPREDSPPNPMILSVPTTNFHFTLNHFVVPNLYWYTMAERLLPVREKNAGTHHRRGAEAARTRVFATSPVSDTSGPRGVSPVVSPVKTPRRLPPGVTSGPHRGLHRRSLAAGGRGYGGGTAPPAPGRRVFDIPPRADLFQPLFEGLPVPEDLMQRERDPGDVGMSPVVARGVALARQLLGSASRDRGDDRGGSPVDVPRGTIHDDAERRRPTTRVAELRSAAGLLGEFPAVTPDDAYRVKARGGTVPGVAHRGTAIPVEVRPDVPVSESGWRSPHEHGASDVAEDAAVRVDRRTDASDQVGAGEREVQEGPSRKPAVAAGDDAARDGRAVASGRTVSGVGPGVESVHDGLVREGVSQAVGAPPPSHQVASAAKADLGSASLSSPLAPASPGPRSVSMTHPLSVLDRLAVDAPYATAAPTTAGGVAVPASTPVMAAAVISRVSPPRLCAMTRAAYLEWTRLMAEYFAEAPQLGVVRRWDDLHPRQVLSDDVFKLISNLVHGKPTGASELTMGEVDACLASRITLTFDDALDDIRKLQFHDDTTVDPETNAFRYLTKLEGVLADYRVYDECSDPGKARFKKHVLPVVLSHAIPDDEFCAELRALCDGTQVKSLPQFRHAFVGIVQSRYSHRHHYGALPGLSKAVAAVGAGAHARGGHGSHGGGATGSSPLDVIVD